MVFFGFFGFRNRFFSVAEMGFPGYEMGFSGFLETTWVQRATKHAETFDTVHTSFRIAERSLYCGFVL